MTFTPPNSRCSCSPVLCTLFGGPSLTQERRTHTPNGTHETTLVELTFNFSTVFVIPLGS